MPLALRFVNDVVPIERRPRDRPSCRPVAGMSARAQVSARQAPIQSDRQFASGSPVGRTVPASLLGRGVLHTGASRLGPSVRRRAAACPLPLAAQSLVRSRSGRHPDDPVCDDPAPRFGTGERDPSLGPLSGAATTAGTSTRLCFWCCPSRSAAISGAAPRFPPGVSDPQFQYGAHTPRRRLHSREGASRHTQSRRDRHLSASPRNLGQTSCRRTRGYTRDEGRRAVGQRPSRLGALRVASARAKGVGCRPTFIYFSRDPQTHSARWSRIGTRLNPPSEP